MGGSCGGGGGDGDASCLVGRGLEKREDGSTMLGVVINLGVFGVIWKRVP